MKEVPFFFSFFLLVISAGGYVGAALCHSFRRASVISTTQLTCLQSMQLDFRHRGIILFTTESYSPLAAMFRKLGRSESSIVIRNGFMKTRLCIAPLLTRCYGVHACLAQVTSEDYLNSTVPRSLNISAQPVKGIRQIKV